MLSAGCSAGIAENTSNQTQSVRSKWSYIVYGISFALIFTAIIGITGFRLEHFKIVGRTILFQYPWRLTHPTTMSHLTAWAGYLLHNLIVWLIIGIRQYSGKGFSNRFHWANWTMLTTHSIFILLHWGQTHLWYDGLAQDVPEVTSFGSVTLLLVIVLMLENPRRGLFFGKQVPFHVRFKQILYHYHGYYFSWATIYTFWFHPTISALGHISGFFYMFMLFWQSILLFHRAHLNKWWTIILEIFVIPHAILVVIGSFDHAWLIFFSGFSMTFILTQLHGLNLNPIICRTFYVTYIIFSLSILFFSQFTPFQLFACALIEYGVIVVIYTVFFLINYFGEKIGWLKKSST